VKAEIAQLGISQDDLRKIWRRFALTLLEIISWEEQNMM
jgi:hypothetical protein